MQIATLKRSPEFQRLRGGLRWSGPGFLIEGKVRGPGARVPPGGPTQPRFGFTVTKKLGGAVARNRIRRRLKEALRTMPPEFTLPGFDYVIIARPPAFDRDFAALTGDFRHALQHFQRASERAAASSPNAASSPTARDHASQGPAARGEVTKSAPKRQRSSD